MTKKEKLINWAREKFERDPNGKILLIEYNLKHSNNWYDEKYLNLSTFIIKNFESLLQHLEKFSDRLVNLEYEEPPVGGNEYYSNFGEYDEVVEMLKSEDIDIDDIGIDDYYWKSSEDLKYFEKN